MATKFKAVTMQQKPQGRVGRAVDAVKKFFGFGKTKGFVPRGAAAKGKGAGGGGGG